MMPMTRVGRAKERGETQGFMKVLVDAESERILGASLLGIEGDEIVHSLLDVMAAGAPYTVIAARRAHPSDGERADPDAARAARGAAGRRREPQRGERGRLTPPASHRERDGEHGHHDLPEQTCAREPRRGPTSAASSSATPARTAIAPAAAAAACSVERGEAVSWRDLSNRSGRRICIATSSEYAPMPTAIVARAMARRMGGKLHGDSWGGAAGAPAPVTSI